MAIDPFLTALHTQRDLLIGTVESFERDAHKGTTFEIETKLRDCRRELALLNNTIVDLEARGP